MKTERDTQVRGRDRDRQADSQMDGQRDKKVEKHRGREREQTMTILSKAGQPNQLLINQKKLTKHQTNTLKMNKK